ncbi:MAG TPA: cupin domain-containing protein [Gaiella sp.]
MPEAQMRETKNGPVVDGEGWFVVNARDSRWRELGALGAYCNFEGKRRFPQLGLNLNVLGPGERIGMYHRENAQEDFLVLSGECTLVVEDEERQLAAWDFFHCPPGTPHIIVAAEGQSAVVLAVGGRGRGVGGGLRYLVSDVAARHGASVAEETTDPSTAYADVYAALPRSTWAPYRDGWLPHL